MARHTTVTRPVETVEDLKRAGFSPQQIERLVAIRESYGPLIEMVDSNQELRRLQFLRWRYQRGDYQSR